MIAAMHCVQCIFFDNVSLLNLQKYVNGQENMPFQGRVAMMPVLRWGMHRYSAEIAALPPDVKWGSEPPSAGKMVSYKTGLWSMFAIVLLSIWYGARRRREFWWVCPSLALLSFYISYGARADQNWWYPYDLPHAALFAAACLCLLEGKWFWMSVALLADMPVRETSIYLVPCMITVGWVQRRLPKALLYASVLAAVWLAMHLVIAWRFQANPKDIGLHRLHFYLMFHFHRYWPQVLSIFGFLWFPLTLLRKYLNKDQSAFLAGMVPGLLTTAVFGIWYESRVWCEWNVVIACLLFSAIMRYYEVHTGAANSSEKSSQGSKEAERGMALQAR